MSLYAHARCGKCLSRGLRRNRASLLIRYRAAVRSGNEAAALIYRDAAAAILAPDVCK